MKKTIYRTIEKIFEEKGYRPMAIFKIKTGPDYIIVITLLMLKTEQIETLTQEIKEKTSINNVIVV